ncbi:hypothetical protein EV182_000315 [Spiromyces aspiralis]|uniref:Uncharacterized protein n=1 Tax=Spiromyces aspiralis TaxID=68401 RepID=A0ACC1HH64_9FUNG|nr:hypothetical protein EV182_000315 [Spiromyces aspiralis]
MFQSVVYALKTNPTGQALFDSLGLTQLSRFWPYILLSALFFHVLSILSDPLSHLIFGAAYAKLPKHKRHSWGIRVASHAHAIFTILASIPIFNSPPLVEDRVFGYTDYASMVYSVVCGYFLWDLFLCITEFQSYGLGFLFHAISALSVYIQGFRPCLQYYGPRFLMLELTTIPLNHHWFMEKLDIGGVLPIVNGVTLAVLYFAVRVVYSTYISYCVFLDLAAVGDLVPTWLHYIYRISNVTSCLLNYFWFYKLVLGFYRRVATMGGGKQQSKAKLQ